MIKFLSTSAMLILSGIFLNFIFVVLCKIMDAVNNQKAYWKVLVVGLILSILSVIMISAEEFEIFKNYVLPQLQERKALSIFVAIIIFYVTFIIIYITNIYILDLWWKIKLKFKR